MALLANRFFRELSDNWHILTVAFSCLLFTFSAPAFMMSFLYPAAGAALQGLSTA